MKYLLFVAIYTVVFVVVRQTIRLIAKRVKK